MMMARVGIVSAAMLMVVAAIGFGVAQAEGNYPWVESGVGSSFDHQQYWALETSDSPGPYAEDRPVLSFEDQDLPQLASPHLENLQMESTVETGSMPSGSNADSIP